VFVLIQIYNSDARGPESVADTVCIHCTNGTEGSFCHECRSGFFRLKSQPLSDACQMYVCDQGFCFSIAFSSLIYPSLIAGNVATSLQ